MTADQREAVKKYDEVKHSLDLAKEFCKQFAQIAKEANREAKRESKRNAFLRIQQESSKIREVLMIQELLRSLADESVRQEFLDGTNGAVKIDQADMDLLEKLYIEVTPKRPTRSDEPSFIASGTHSANTLASVIDGRPKPFAESTYEHVRDILQSIQNSGYFEKDIVQVVAKDDVTTGAGDDDQPESIESSDDVKTDNSGAGGALEEDLREIEAPNAKVVPVPEQLINSHVAPTTILPPSAPVAAAAAKDPLYPPLPPNTVAVRAVEHRLQKQYLQQQQIRPTSIHEVLGPGGNFSFLQDSELDTADPSEFASVVMPSQPQPSPQKPPQQMGMPPPPNQVAQTALQAASAVLPQTAQAVLPPQTFAQNYPSMVAQQLPMPPFAKNNDVLPPPHIPAPFALPTANQPLAVSQINF